MELEDVTISSGPTQAHTAPTADLDEPAPSGESQVPARIYPEYANISATQVETETARLKNRLRALAIRFESCDRTLGHALLTSHRAICADAGGREALARISEIEAQRATAVSKTNGAKSTGDGLLGGLLGPRRPGPRRVAEGGTTEGDLRVPEPIDRELVELARAVATDRRIAELPDETVRASLVKRAELAIEGADLEGRLRFLRRRTVPSTLEHPRASGDFRASASAQPLTAGVTQTTAPATVNTASQRDPTSQAELPQTVGLHLTAIDQRLERNFTELAHTLAELARRLPTAGGTQSASDDEDRARSRHDELLTHLGRLEEQLATRLAALDESQRTLTHELTDAFTHHEEAQLRILEREAELRACRLEVASAQLAAETVRKQAAEAELEVVRTSHAVRIEEEQLRMRVDAARHAQTMREQEDAQARAIDRVAEEARLHATEQTRAREARTAEIERMARLRSRAESAATSRRIREARERRRNTLIWVSVVSGLTLLIFGLLWASGMLGAAAQYLRNQSSPPSVETPAPAGAPQIPTTGRSRPTR